MTDNAIDSRIFVMFQSAISRSHGKPVSVRISVGINKSFHLNWKIIS